MRIETRTKEQIEQSKRAALDLAKVEARSALLISLRRRLIDDATITSGALMYAQHLSSKELETARYDLTLELDRLITDSNAQIEALACTIEAYDESEVSA